MIIKVSFMVVASVAALKISQTKTNNSIKRNGNDVSHLEQEFEERETSTANSNNVIQNEEEKQISTEMPQKLLSAEYKDFKLLIGGEKFYDVTKKEILQNLVRSYKQREVNIEKKLLELNGLREEQSAIAQMQRQLQKKTAKLDVLKKTIASLQSESKGIQEKIREDILAKKQLHITNNMINEMQRKKGVNGSNFKEQILMLQQQVTELEKHNCSGENIKVNKKLENVQDMELEVLELNRRNKELELDKREIRMRLATAQARIRTEVEREAEIKEEITGLRHVHEELSEQVERLQSSRFDMVQELVYQRWLHTLLKFEVHDHQKQSIKASKRDCSHNSSKDQYEKTHALTSDPEVESVSSNATLDDSDETETTTFESSSSSQSSSSKNSSILSKMQRWRKTNDHPIQISAKGRNFPSRVAPASDESKSRNSGDTNSPVINLSKNMNCSSKSSEEQIMPKIKRVSFSDSVRLSTYQDMPEAIESAMNDKETRSGQIMELTTSVVRAENFDETRNSNECVVGNPVNSDSIAKSKIGHSDELYPRNEIVCKKDDRMMTQVVQLVVAFYLSALILLAYFWIK
ncbi:hypothetical protein RJT34_15319 [Clitoria ternatea]|uniref:Protein CHUP1, chloroplastic n=1 Tax=Clitoria ternatea TaxID=43366 RepID=A0AAN9JRL3_CLITE